MAEDGSPEGKEVTKRRASLEERLHRSRNLYELGDLTRPEYMARREAINTELAQLAPEPIPDLDQAQPPETAASGVCKERERRGSDPDFAPGGN